MSQKMRWPRLLRAAPTSWCSISGCRRAPCRAWSCWRGSARIRRGERCPSSSSPRLVPTRIAKKTTMVLPLYNEEVHILGRRGITDFDDLAGRRVAVGREGSGTYLTSRLLFKLAEVTPAESVLIDTDEALAELKAGRI